MAELSSQFDTGDPCVSDNTNDLHIEPQRMEADLLTSTFLFHHRELILWISGRAWEGGFVNRFGTTRSIVDSECEHVGLDKRMKHFQVVLWLWLKFQTSNYFLLLQETTPQNWKTLTYPQKLVVCLL